MDAIAILTGGGPAPGMNTVVGSVAKTFLEKGYRVLGLHCGYSSLFTKNPRITEIDFLLADDIFNRGGSFLTMSRFKPTDKNFEEDFNLDLFVKNNITLLVTVGGDDTASTANRIAKFLEAKNIRSPIFMFPKRSTTTCRFRPARLRSVTSRPRTWGRSSAARSIPMPARAAIGSSWLLWDVRPDISLSVSARPAIIR